MTRITTSACRFTTGLLAIMTSATSVMAQDTVFIDGTDRHNVTRELAVDRYPALYTGDFADCLGGESLFNITKFDVGYYADNMTVVFHLDGATNVRSEDIVYGEPRFNAVVDPCDLNITSLCPVNAENPIEAWAALNISDSDFDGFPSISLDIPDFEGSARVRLFANSSQTEIGCFQAVMVNGNTFSHPYAISPALGGLTAIAILSSFATAIYGLSIPHIRTHYAHAFSVLVIFETFQTIFFSGALSVNWPAVLPAWWSNFAWSAGLVYSKELVGSLQSFAGISGNASQVGGAGSAVINNEGGLVQQIYGRSLDLDLTTAASQLASRALRYNESDPYDYTWGGRPVSPGMPIPGTRVGFAGALAPLHIPIAGAFLIGIIWWLVALVLVVIAVIACKLALELLARTPLVKTDGFAYFRSHLGGYLTASILRTLLIASFPLITLAMIQFNLRSPIAPKAIAGVVFGLLLIGMGGLVAYGCYFRLRFGRYEMGPDTIVFEQGRLFKAIPFVAATRQSTIADKESTTKRFGSVPFFRIRFIDDDPQRTSVHKDEAYVKRFGWLAAHYRRKRWWFFVLWFSYQFVRACFLGGGYRNPMAQVFGLFILEIIALFLFIRLRPYESQRNSVVAVWILGIAKVITSGLSIAFLPDFGNSRITLTALGLIIIIVQGFAALAVVVLAILGVASSWMSVNRNRETFKPAAMDGLRVSYYEHLQNKAPDMPPPPRPAGRQDDPDMIHPQSTFTVNSVRRKPKIEDDDEDAVNAIRHSNNSSVVQFAPPVTRPARSNSVTSSRYSVGALPRRARAHRASWSSKDFSEWEAQFERPESAMGSSIRASHGGRQRSSSLRQSAHLNSSLRLEPDIPERPRSSMDNRRPMPIMRESAEDRELPRLTIPPQIQSSGAASKAGKLAVDDNGVSPISEQGEGANAVPDKVTEEPAPVSPAEDKSKAVEAAPADVAPEENATGSQPTAETGEKASSDAKPKA